MNPDLLEIDTPQTRTLDETVHQIAREQFGLTATIKRLTGERDENFRLDTSNGRTFVLKIANPSETFAVTDLSTQALLHLEATAPDMPCPRVIRDVHGRTLTPFSEEGQSTRWIRLVSYLPGLALRASARTTEQQSAFGTIAARMGQALKGFEHAGANRELIWDLRHTGRIRALLEALPSLPDQDFLSDFLETYAADIAPRLDVLRRQVVHNDLNANNVLVDPTHSSRITGIIDFGDMVHTALIADIAIAASAQISDKISAAGAIATMLEAYTAVEPITPDELAILPALISARVVCDVIIPTWHRTRHAGNPHYERVNEDYVRHRLSIARALLALDLRTF